MTTTDSPPGETAELEAQLLFKELGDGVIDVGSSGRC